ncbi:MAG TPA: tetratricopeptide repeat protein [Spirochaetia bacterium]|nr:tetratricopeptide repeat protein [Spirochaetia bacterium]
MQPVQQATDRRQEPEQPLRRRISNFLAATVSRFRIVLLGILIAAAAFMVGYFIYTEVSRKLASDSTILAEGTQSLYDKWKTETDAAKKGALEKQLMDQLGVLIGRYSRQYGGQRGLFIRADVYSQDKAWDNAQKDYQTLAGRFPASYLAPISLFNAGVCLEEKGDAEAALKLYLQVTRSYPDSPVAPRALFDAGRLDEQKGSFEDARKMYDQIDSLYPSSTWDKLAKNRVIELRVLGKTK